MTTYTITTQEDLDTIKRRSLTSLLDTPVSSTVKEMILNVQANRDEALIEYTQKFDKINLENLRVPTEVLQQAIQQMPQDLYESLEAVAKNIRQFHQMQMNFVTVVWESSGKRIQLRYDALNRAGVYVPGGLAAYPSSVLMNVIPAQVAGVKEIAVFTPPSNNPTQTMAIYGACALLGIEEVYSLGGAQAIAAAALGTNSIKPVDIITGPGNQYVTEAKRQLSGLVKIDMLAGPSELMIIVDSTSSPDFVAADLLAQAEHDENALLYLVAVNSDIEKIQAALKEQLVADAESVAAKSIANMIVYECSQLDYAIALSNLIAPEHLSLQFDNASAYTDQFLNAGSIFIGDYAPEAIGDYGAGANHVLPTAGTARFDSGLNVLQFMKQTQLIEYTQDALMRDMLPCEIIATYERLPYHKNSLSIRRTL